MLQPVSPQILVGHSETSPNGSANPWGGLRHRGGGAVMGVRTNLAKQPKRAKLPYISFTLWVSFGISNSGHGGRGHGDDTPTWPPGPENQSTRQLFPIVRQMTHQQIKSGSFPKGQVLKRFSFILFLTLTTKSSFWGINQRIRL